MGRQIGIAIIGVGYWGVNYIRVFNELPDSQVVMVCDKRAERLEEISARFPEVELTTDIDDVLSNHAVDAVVVCTPATTHFAVASACLRAGKHVLVEKPITKNSIEAETLTQLAQEQGQILMVGHTFIYNPGIRKVKEYLDHNEMGRVYYLYAQRTNMGPIRFDVNALWDLAPHDVSIFNYLLNSSPVWVSAVGARVLRNSREDVGFITLGYPSNVLAHIHVSWADANKVRQVVVVGSHKRIIFNDADPLERVRVFDKGVSMEEVEASTYGEFTLRMRDGDILSPHIESTEPLKSQCTHLLECIRDGKTPLTDGWAGREVVRVMEAVDLSIAHNGAPQAVEYQDKPNIGEFYAPEKYKSTVR